MSDFTTIYDVSKETVLSSDFSWFVVAALAVAIPLGALLFWIEFRYKFMGPRTTIFLGLIKLSETSQPIYNAHRAFIRNGGLFVYGLVLLIGTIIATLIVVGEYRTHNKCVQALQTHEAKMVEGPIQEFEPYGASVHTIPQIHDVKTESFMIQNVLFVYSREFGDGGFTGSPEASAMLSKAKMARVWYIDGYAIDKKIILRLDLQ
jgi:hypothetical protein